MADEALTIDFELFGIDKATTALRDFAAEVAKLPKTIAVTIVGNTKQGSQDKKEKAAPAAKSPRKTPQEKFAEAELIKDTRAANESRRRIESAALSEQIKQTRYEADLARRTASQKEAADRAESSRKMNAITKAEKEADVLAKEEKARAAKSERDQLAANKADAKLKAAAEKKAEREQLAADKADAAAAKAKAKADGAFGKAVKNALFTTRFTPNAQGGISFAPLVGRVMGVLGKMGPLGIALGVITSAFMVLHSVVNAAAQKMNELTRARFTGGGSYKDVGRAAGLAAVLGVSPGEVASMARGFADTLAEGGAGTAFGHRYGIRDPWGSSPYGGDVNKFTNLFKAAEAIMKIPDEETAIRTARSFGPEMEKLLDLRILPEKERQEALRTQNEMFGPQQALAAMRYRIAMGNLSNSMSELQMAVVPLIDAFTGAIALLKYTIKNVFGPLAKWTYQLFGPKQDKTKEDSSTKKHIDAMDRNTEAILGQITAMRQIFGGGARASGALPINLRGQTLSDALRNDAIKLGAFSL